MTRTLIIQEDVNRSSKEVVFFSGTLETGSCCEMLGAFMPGAAMVARAAPQLLQKTVPSSNLVPHFVHKAIEIPRCCSWSRLFLTRGNALPIGEEARFQARVATSPRQIDSPGSHIDQPEEAMPHEVQKCACGGTGLPQLEQNEAICVTGTVATCCGGTDIAALNAFAFVPICP